jgi:D-aminoacyl-tRNA deacylase
MRVVVQRVKSARVSIEGVVKGAIGPGLLALLGIAESDTSEDISWMTGKLARMRVFDDPQGVMNLSLREVGGEILVVSQFTLLASTRKGNRPSYSRAARPEVAAPIYEQFVAQLKTELAQPVPTGEFGAMMEVSLVNDGPVTLILDSQLRE